MQLHLDDLYTIASTGYHCAFPSCLLWRGKLYVAYREAHSHGVYPPGKIAVLTIDLSDGSPYVERNISVHTSGDDRDPKLFDVGKRGLGLCWGTYYPRWPQDWVGAGSVQGQSVDLISHLALSRDGVVWSPSYQTFRPNYWLWSVCQWENIWHGAAYHFGGDGSHSVHHLVSADGIDWVYRACIVPEIRASPGGLRKRQPSEPCLFAQEDMLHCAIRQEEDGFLLATLPDIESGWTYERSQTIVHAPAVVKTPYGLLLGGRAVHPPAESRGQRKGREHGEKPPKREASMELWGIAPPSPALTPLLSLPSWGDCAYSGLAWDEARDTLWCVYYSQHAYKAGIEDGTIYGNPTPADVYLAKIHVEA